MDPLAAFEPPERLYFPFSDRRPALSPGCLTLDALVTMTLVRGFESIDRADKVVEAVNQSKVVLGRLIPHLNYGTFSSSANTGYLDLLPSMLGAIFPSNWYAWGESNAYARAEAESFRTFLANTVIQMEKMYYTVAISELSIEVLEYYWQLVNHLADTMSVAEAGRIEAIDHTAMIRAVGDIIRIDMIDHRKIINELMPVIAWDSNARSELCFSFEAFEWLNPDLPKDLFATALAKSSEMRTYDALIEAAHYEKKGRMYSFLAPGGGNLGFGTRSNIQIGRQHEAALCRKRLDVEAELRAFFRRMTTEFANSLQLREAAELSRAHNQAEYHAMVGALAAKDAERLADLADRFIPKMLQAELAIVRSFHENLIAQARLRRLLWQGTRYDVEAYIPFTETPRKPTRWQLHRGGDDR